MAAQASPDIPPSARHAGATAVFPACSTTQPYESPPHLTSPRPDTGDSLELTDVIQTSVSLLRLSHLILPVETTVQDSDPLAHSPAG